jgi:hypothetical protein
MPFRCGFCVSIFRKHLIPAFPQSKIQLGRICSGISSISFLFAHGQHHARNARTQSCKRIFPAPAEGSTRPRKLILSRHRAVGHGRDSVSALSTAVAMAMPALGPSFGTAPCVHAMNIQLESESGSSPPFGGVGAYILSSPRGRIPA